MGLVGHDVRIGVAVQRVNVPLAARCASATFPFPAARCAEVYAGSELKREYGANYREANV